MLSSWRSGSFWGNWPFFLVEEDGGHMCGISGRQGRSTLKWCHGSGGGNHHPLALWPLVSPPWALDHFMTSQTVRLASSLAGMKQETQGQQSSDPAVGFFCTQRKRPLVLPFPLVQDPPFLPLVPWRTPVLSPGQMAFNACSKLCFWQEA